MTISPVWNTAHLVAQSAGSPANTLFAFGLTRVIPTVSAFLQHRRHWSRVAHFAARRRPVLERELIQRDTKLAAAMREIPARVRSFW